MLMIKVLFKWSWCRFRNKIVSPLNKMKESSLQPYFVHVHPGPRPTFRIWSWYYCRNSHWRSIKGEEVYRRGTSTYVTRSSGVDCRTVFITNFPPPHMANWKLVHLFLSGFNQRLKAFYPFRCETKTADSRSFYQGKYRMAPHSSVTCIFILFVWTSFYGDSNY